MLLLSPYFALYSAGVFFAPLFELIACLVSIYLASATSSRSKPGDTPNHHPPRTRSPFAGSHADQKAKPAPPTIQPVLLLLLFFVH